MSQISKCPNMRVVLTYWEALRDVSGLSYKSLLYFSSNGSYCTTMKIIAVVIWMMVRATITWVTINTVECSSPHQ